MSEAASRLDLEHPYLAFAPHTDVDVLVVTSEDGICLDVSDNVEMLAGVRADRLIGRAPWEIVAPRDAAMVRAAWSRLQQAGRIRSTLRLHHFDGRPIWFDVVTVPFGVPGGRGEQLWLWVGRDVTDDVQATEHLTESERRWRLAFEHSPVGTAMVTLDGCITLANDSLGSMLEYRSSSLSSLSVDDITHADDRALDAPRLAALRRGELASYTVEKRFVTSSGKRLWGQMTAAAVPDLAGGLDGVIVQVQDVTQRREAELELASRALHDPLSGLANRFLVQQWLTGALAEHLGGSVGVLYCDLDRFKLVNDSLGHAAGDEVILEAALRLRATVRPEDLVGRVGGDEFVIVCERIDGPEDLLSLAERIATAFDDAVVIDGNSHLVTLSIGATVAADGDTAERVLRRADMALLRAKRLGRARAELFDPQVDKVSTRDDLQLEDDLRLSVQGEQLVVHYQPIVAIEGFEVVGHEALLRWEHPDRGLMQPGQFLDIAETSGLIRTLGWWVLERACRDVADGSLSDGWVSVNASPIQLSRANVTKTVVDAIEAYGIPANRLHIEITETALMQASKTLVEELSELRDMGVSIALDDFGTGFSSLSLLRDFPVSTVKIDKSFVLPLLEDRGAMAIVRAVIGMGRDLGLPVIAEGVETEAQANCLAELGCSHAQGFFFGRPIPLMASGELS